MLKNRNSPVQVILIGSHCVGVPEVKLKARAVEADHKVAIVHTDRKRICIPNWIDQKQF